MVWATSMTESEVGRRVEIDPQLVGVVEIVRPRVPRVQVEAVHLGHPHDVLDLEGEEHRSRSCRREGDVDGGSSARRHTLHVEGLGIDALRPALQHRRPVVDVPQRADPTHGKVFGDVELRPAAIGEHDLGGARDAHLDTVRIHRRVRSHPTIMAPRDRGRVATVVCQTASALRSNASRIASASRRFRSQTRLACPPGSKRSKLPRQCSASRRVALAGM
jgi:hypothetical protein